MTPLTSEVLAELKERLAAYEKLNATAVGGDKILMARWSAAKGLLEVSLLRHAPALLAAAERLLEMESEKPKAQATIIDTHIQGLRRVRNEHGSGPTPELDARIEALESLQAENAALRAEVERLKNLVGKECDWCGDPATKIEPSDVHGAVLYSCDACSAEYGVPSTPPATEETDG